MHTHSTAAPRSSHTTGIFYALAAYVSWGLLPLYWKTMHHVPAYEVLAHRVFWSCVFMVALIAATRKLPSVFRQLRMKRTMLILAATGTILSGNWFIFIWAVNSDHVVQASLGYYISPLTSVLLGVIVLGERLNRAQSIAVALAVVGIVNQILSLGTIPWVALALATSFSIYALIRKQASVDPMIALCIESILIAPAALAFILYLHTQGTGEFGLSSPTTSLFLAGTGIITAIPLLWFTQAVQRLPMTTIGFFQYLLPTLQLLLGVFLYNEPFTHAHALTFSCIWCGLIIFIIDTRRRMLRSRQ